MAKYRIVEVTDKFCTYYEVEIAVDGQRDDYWELCEKFECLVYAELYVEGKRPPERKVIREYQWVYQS